MSSTPYKRRKPSLIRNLWVYRNLIAVAFVLGVILWFVFINNVKVDVYFPFNLGSITMPVGIIILLSALGGALLTLLAIGFLYALRRLKAAPSEADVDRDNHVLSDDLPPSDYGATTPEGFGNAPWSGRD